MFLALFVFINFVVISKMIVMNNFEKESYKTVSDEELRQVSGGESNIGVDPCTLNKSETECINAGCRWLAYNETCLRTSLRFI